MELTRELSTAAPSFAQRQIEKFLSRAGVRVGGAAPWDITVHDERFFGAVLRDGTMGLGESYVEGWWDCTELDKFVHKLCLVPRQPSRGLKKYLTKAQWLVMNMQSRARARQIAEYHYDLSNEFFQLWLDPNMQYSCAYWEGATTLEQAQLNKLDLVSRKLHASPGDRILEVGCGWGGLARHLALKGAHVTAVNISKEQMKFARAWNAGLPVDVVDTDYRGISGQWDKAVSVAMLEAVGAKNLRVYMETVHRALKDDGVFVLHSIGENVTKATMDRWIEKYIFPNCYIPSVAQLGKAMEGLFVLEDWHNIGPDYDKTLMCWNERFEAAWPKIRELDPKFNERFRRMWRYYLLNSAGWFRARVVQLWQLTLTKHRTGTHYDRILRR
jgi:cyclopropane-fatty-acyl-phospholipid synthase